MKCAKLFGKVVVFITVIWLPLSGYAECRNDVPARKPDGNYFVHADGTVTDRITGLMWKLCPEGMAENGGYCVQDGSVYSFTWQAALQHAKSLNNSGGYAGYTDWRVPNRNELGSLIDRGCRSPAMNSSVFPLGVTFASSGPTWSSTSSDGAFAWVVNLGTGSIEEAVATWDYYLLRLVRGGQ